MIQSKKTSKLVKILLLAYRKLLIVSEIQTKKYENSNRLILQMGVELWESS